MSRTGPDACSPRVFTQVVHFLQPGRSTFVKTFHKHAKRISGYPPDDDDLRTQ
jgi:hypothetical protein